MAKKERPRTGLFYYSMLGLGIALLAVAITCLAITLTNVSSFERALSFVLLTGSFVLLFSGAFLIVWAFTTLWVGELREADYSLYTAAALEAMASGKEEASAPQAYQELVQHFKDELNELRKIVEQQQEKLAEARSSVEKLEGTLGLWLDQAIKMFRLMERTLTHGEQLNADYKRAVEDLLKQYTALVEHLGLIPIVPQRGDRFDEHLHSIYALEPSLELAGGQVISCVSWGFVVDDQVRVPAEVVVAQN